MADEGSEPKRASKLVLAILFAPILIIGGCTALLVFPWKSVAPTSSATASAAGARYTQTWRKEYKVTTCSEWLNQMTDAQRWAASADILAAARNKISGGKGMPSDALVTRFEQNISTGCEGSGQITILEAAYVIYNYDDTFKP